MLLTIVSRCAAAASAESLSDDCEAGDRFGMGMSEAGGDGEVSLLNTGWKAENLRLDVVMLCIIAVWYGFNISKFLCIAIFLWLRDNNSVWRRFHSTFSSN